MNEMDDGLIMSSAIPDGQKAVIGKKDKPESSFRRFMNSGWGVAAACALVSISVLGGIVWAGWQPGTRPPAGTTDPASESVEPTTEEAATEAETLSELEEFLLTAEPPVLEDGQTLVDIQACEIQVPMNMTEYKTTILRWGLLEDSVNNSAWKLYVDFLDPTSGSIKYSYKSAFNGPVYENQEKFMSSCTYGGLLYVGPSTNAVNYPEVKKDPILYLPTALEMALDDGREGGGARLLAAITPLGDSCTFSYEEAPLLTGEMAGKAFTRKLIPELLDLGITGIYEKYGVLKKED